MDCLTELRAAAGGGGRVGCLAELRAAGGGGRVDCLAELRAPGPCVKA